MSLPRVVLAGFYPPPFAGEPIHVKQLAGLLRERGLEVTVLNLNRHAPASHEYVTARRPSGLMRLLLALPERSAILHLHTNGHSWKSWLMIATAAFTARTKRVRTILTIHSGLFPGYVSTLGWARRGLGRWILRSFSCLVAVNYEIGQAMERMGIAATRIAVIPAFLGVRQPDTLDAKSRALIEGAVPLLVAVGGGDRDPELGLPTVIEALPSLLRTYPSLRAIFIGWQVGPKTQPLIEARGLGPHAMCLGQVSHEECLQFIQAADVVVRSTFADGDAITVREALDLQVPVVASDTAFRPPGVVLFRKGDARDLEAKLAGVLAAPRARPEPGPATAQPARDLWRVYTELLGPESGAASPSSAPAGSRARVTPP
jgi:glycogen synthase